MRNAPAGAFLYLSTRLQEYFSLSNRLLRFQNIRIGHCLG
jgi:hypothetical protein